MPKHRALGDIANERAAARSGDPVAQSKCNYYDKVERHNNQVNEAIKKYHNYRGDITEAEIARERSMMNMT